MQLESKTKKQEKMIENKQETTIGDKDLVFYLKWSMIGLLAVVVGVISLYVTRRSWLSYLLIARFKGKTHGFSEAYEVLLKQLKRAGLKREEGQTLRDY